MQKPRRGALDRQPKRFRGILSRGIALSDGEAQVEHDGGIYGAGLIRGFAVVTRGEALGHGYWLDATFVEQTREALAIVQRSNNKGAKARFTHPGMSADGLGKGLGRTRDGCLAAGADTLRADLHFSKTAHRTPDGDLAAYVLELAEEDPSMFGASIVYSPDWGEEEKFQANNKDEAGYFRSPDPDNVQHLPHARLHRLHAVDIVDEPAANPMGMFSADPVFTDVNALASYALGLTDEAPALEQLDHNPDRVRVFVRGFLDRNNLELKERTMSDGKTKPADETKPADDEQTKPAADETKPADDEQSDASETETDGGADPADEKGGDGSDAEESGGDAGNTETEGGERDQSRGAAVAELRKFTKAFGAENGAKWFDRGYSFEQAQDVHEEFTRLRAQSSHEQASDADGVSSGDENESEQTRGMKNALGGKLGAYASTLKLAGK